MKITPKKLYYWGLLGLVPNFGAIGGLVLLIKGIFQYKDKKLILIGIADILFTIIFWTAFIYWTENGETWKKLNNEMAQKELNTLVKHVEFYKIQHGFYPDSLTQIETKKDVFIMLYEPFHRTINYNQSRLFNYYKVDDGYHLSSSGFDEMPNTKDDIYPSSDYSDPGKIGLIIK
jgi:hypothetical protein